MRLRKRGWMHMHLDEITAAVSEDNIYLAYTQYECCLRTSGEGLYNNTPALSIQHNNVPKCTWAVSPADKKHPTHW
jgi:hypothetical protein